MLLISRPHHHLEVARHVFRIVASLRSSLFAGFVRHVQVKLHVAEVECECVIEYEEAFYDENVQDHVVLHDLIVIARQHILRSAVHSDLRLIAREVIDENILVRFASH